MLTFSELLQFQLVLYELQIYRIYSLLYTLFFDFQSSTMTTTMTMNIAQPNDNDNDEKIKDQAMKRGLAELKELKIEVSDWNSRLAELEEDFRDLKRCVRDEIKRSTLIECFWFVIVLCCVFRSFSFLREPKLAPAFVAMATFFVILWGVFGFQRANGFGVSKTDDDNNNNNNNQEGTRGFFLEPAALNTDTNFNTQLGTLNTDTNFNTQLGTGGEKPPETLLAVLGFSFLALIGSFLWWFYWLINDWLLGEACSGATQPATIGSG